MRSRYFGAVPTVTAGFRQGTGAGNGRVALPGARPLMHGMESPSPIPVGPHSCANRSRPGGYAKCTGTLGVSQALLSETIVPLHRTVPVPEAAPLSSATIRGISAWKKTRGAWVALTSPPSRALGMGLGRVQQGSGHRVLVALEVSVGSPMRARRTGSVTTREGSRELLPVSLCCFSFVHIAPAFCSLQFCRPASHECHGP